MFIGEYSIDGGVAMSITQHIEEIWQNIEQASLIRQQRTLEERLVKLVAVTKNHGTEIIQKAIDSGIQAVGENRVQEALSKQPILGRQLEWHLIGHLQTNKARQAVPAFDLIHSVDNEKLALEIDRVAAKLGKRQDILLQVNVAGEATKFGIAPEQLQKLVHFVTELKNVQLCGLMTIAPHYEETETVRPVFRELHNLFVELREARLPNTNIQWLSMGMTNDYQIAIEEGSNLVRIGTGIFGTRQ